MVPSTGLADGGSAWTDVPKGYWAKGAIDYVALEHDWMRDFGTATFKPDGVETRKLLARAIVRAFAPGEDPNPAIKFKDLPPDDRFYPFANVAVKLGWMGTVNGQFRPDMGITLQVLHRALVYALGLGRVAAGASKFATADGYTFQHPTGFGSTLLGMVLGLRYNHDEESLDVGPGTPLSRAEAAWSLYRASVIDTRETWRKSEVAVYADMHVGAISPVMRKVVEFGLKYVGYPYIYAGEWYRRTPSAYCCGEQPRGGFDCSGLMWWMLKAPSTGYDNTKVRPYAGWMLGERSSNDMAKAIPKTKRIPFDKAKAGDLLFYDSDHDGTIDHVNLFLGNGWALDSGSNGVTIIRVNDGWYADKFKWARHVVTSA